MLIEEPRGAKPKKPEDKYKSSCVKLNNNHIQETADLLDVVGKVVVEPAAFTWIDLSFNDIAKVDPVSAFI